MATKRPASTEGASSSPKRHASAEGINIADLLKEFERFGEVEKPAAESDIPKQAPPQVRDMLLAASQWRLQKNSGGIDGFNIFDKGKFIEKVQLFGDKECMKEWAEKQQKPNCGEDGWECIACVSETDFIFVNVDKNSKDFEATRIIRNNGPKDVPLTSPPFSNFLEKTDTYVKMWLKYAEENKDKKNWLDDTPMFSNEMVTWK